MIRGSIISNKSAAIIIPIGKNDSVQEVTVFIDTGFTGDLKVPLELASDLDILNDASHTEFIQLADGSLVPAAVSKVDVSIDGQTKTVEVLIQDGDTLIGVGLLRKFCCILKIDFRDNIVELERHL